MLLISLFQYSFERLLRNIKKKFPVFLLFWRIPQRVFTSVFSSVIIVAYSSLALSFIVNFMFPGYFSCYLHCTLEVQTHEVLHFGHLCRIFFFFFFNCVTYETSFITRCLFLLLLHHKCYRFEREFFYSRGFFNLAFLTSTFGARHCHNLPQKVLLGASSSTLRAEGFHAVVQDTVPV